MFKQKVNNFVPQFISIFLIIWGAASFFVFPSLEFVQYLFLAFSIFAIIFALQKKLRYFTFIITCFSNVYGLYGLLFTYGLPVWIIMIGLAVILGFLYHQLSKDHVDENFLIYLSLFIVLCLEIFLTLSYYLVNPMTRSLIIVIFSHLYFGFVGSLSHDSIDSKNIYSYLYLSLFLLILVFLTVTWGH